MSKNIVHSGQSFLNKVIECTGDIENAFAMALLNGIDVTDTVPAGTELKASAVTKTNVAEFFTADNRPATALVTIAENDNEFNFGFPEGEFPISF